MRRDVSENDIDVFMKSNVNLSGRNIIERDDFLAIFRESIDRARNYNSTYGKDGDHDVRITSQYEEEISKRSVHQILSQTIKLGCVGSVAREVGKLADHSGSITKTDLIDILSDYG